MQQLPSGNWRVQTCINGKRVSRTFTTIEEAEYYQQVVKTSRKGRTNVTDQSKLKQLKKKLKEGADVFKMTMMDPVKELRAIDKMDGIAFEQYCKKLLLGTGEFIGGFISETSTTRDFGADLVVHCFDGTIIVVQCKRISNNANIAAIQEVIGAKNFIEADRAAVMTNRDFTRSARELADRPKGACGPYRPEQSALQGRLREQPMERAFQES